MSESVLVFGGSGLVGSRFIYLQSENLDIIAPTHQEVDLTDTNNLITYVRDINPNQILYAAGQANVDQAEEELLDLTQRLNVGVVTDLVGVCSDLKIPFYYLSTDYVFDGQSDKPYKEDDPKNPLGEYARSKSEGEDETLTASNRNGVIRLIMPFSAHFDKKLDLARLTLDKLKREEKLSGIVDQKINPIFVDDLVRALAIIMKENASGIYHLGATSFVSPYQYMLEIAKQFNLDQNLVEQTDFATYSQTRSAKRPQNSWLDTTKFRREFGEGILHTFEEEISEFKKQMKEN